MKKPIPGSTPIKPMPNAWGSDEFKINYPMLTEFISATKWDDGSPRVPGSISIFVQVGVLKACVNDKDLGRMFFAEAPTFDELLALIDMGICNDSTEWKAQAKRIPY